MSRAATDRVLQPGGVVIIGADPRCDLVVGGAGVSPRHCGLRHRGDCIELWDCSRDGSVRFAGAQVVRVMLPLDGAFEMARKCVKLRVAARTGIELLPDMLGTSAPMQRLAEVVGRAARLHIPVLLRGESGSGKELTARAIHALSQRAAGPFVAINGAGLTDTMAASALFGHVRGGFTGAETPRLGAFRQAHGGTLFIDEVAAIPLATQALLLRALEDFFVRPVGADEGTSVDVRVVTATCERLEYAVREGAFRPDLYQRIATCIVQLPPLRARTCDLPELAQQTLDQTLPGTRLGRNATAALAGYAFPGNVRELRNVLMQAAIESVDGIITAELLSRVLRHRAIPDKPPPDNDEPCSDDVVALLEQYEGNVSLAARAAGMPRSTFRDRLRRARHTARSHAKPADFSAPDSPASTGNRRRASPVSQPRG